MIKVKNVRPGILIIADAGIKLAPGETTEVESATRQMSAAIADGMLARIDVEAEAQSKARSISRSATSKAEAKKQPVRTADTKPKPGADGSDGSAVDKFESETTGEPAGDAGAEHVATDGSQPGIPGVDDDGK